MWPLAKNLRRAISVSSGLVKRNTTTTSSSVVRPRVNAKPLHLADSDDEEHRGGEERHEVGDQDGAPGTRPGPLHGGSQRASFPDLVTDAFEVHDERVRRDADRDDGTAHGRQVQREADGRAEQRHDHVRETGGDQQRGDGDERQAPVVHQQVEDDQGETDRAGDQTGFELLTAERGGDGGDAVLLEGQRQSAVGQHVGEALGLLLVEVAGDLRAATGERLADVRVGDDLVVQDDGELVLRGLVLRQLAGDVGELLAALVRELHGHGPAGAGLRVEDGLGLVDVGAVDRRGPRTYFCHWPCEF